MSSSAYTSTYLPLMLLQSGLFVATWTAVDVFVNRHGPVSAFRGITSFNSRFYSLVSVLLLVATLAPSLGDTARKCYHISKFYEYVDIINVRASGGQIGLHFGFHHLTTPYFTFFRVLQHHRRWEVFAALNAFHHVLMYAYFGGLQAVRPVLDWTGQAQLIIGIAVEAWCIGEARAAGDALWPHVFGGGLLSGYLCLSVRDLMMRSHWEKQEARGKKEG